MNDFFSNLAARSFDHTEGIELVRPRLPSLFESAPEKRHDLTEMPSGLERTEVFESNNRDRTRWEDGQEPMQLDRNFESRKNQYGRSVQPLNDEERGPSHPAGKFTATGNKPHVGGDPGNQARPQFESSEGSPNHSRLKVEEISTSPSPVRFEQPVRPIAELSPSIMSTWPDSGSEEAEQPVVVTEKMRAGSEQPPKQVAVPPVVIDRIRLIERIKQVIDRELPSGEKEIESRKAITARAAFKPIEPAVSRREETAFRRAISKPEPTINVTIGRIEVRAVMPDKVEKRKATSNEMSLDEYLAGRRGGRS